MKLKNSIIALAFVLSSLLAARAEAFPFWLEAPSGRTNDWDRQNPNSKWNSVVVATNTPVDTPTSSVTPTITPTFTNSPPVTSTDTPTITATHTISPTQTITPTFTFSPFVVTTPTFSPTAAVVMYDDMENPGCAFYGGYNDGTATGFGDPVAETVVVHSGAGSWYQTFNTATIWGNGFGFGAMGSCISIDARPISPTHAYIWIKTDQDLTLYFTFIEDVGVLGGNPERYTSPAMQASASPSWQLIEARLTDFVPNGYFHTTLGNPMDNSVFDYVVSEADIQYGTGTGALVNVYLDDFGFADRSLAVPKPVKVDDFEGGLCYDGTYCDDADCGNGAGTDIAQSYDTVTFHAGAQSLLLQATVDSVLDSSGYGGGFYWGYPGACGGEVNIEGLSKFEFWVKTDYSVNMNFILREGMNVDPNRPGDNGEYWQLSAPVNIPVAGGAWQLVSIPLADFNTETATSTGLAPGGDDTFNTTKVFDIQIQFATDQVGPRTLANVFIDDIYFVP